MASPGQANVRTFVPQLVVLGLITCAVLAVYVIQSPSDVTTALGRAGITIGPARSGDTKTIDHGFPSFPASQGSFGSAPPPSANAAPPAANAAPPAAKAAPPAPKVAPPATKAAPATKTTPIDTPVPATPTKPLSAAYAGSRALIDAARSTPGDPIPTTVATALTAIGVRDTAAYINMTRDVSHGIVELPWRSAKLSKVLAPGRDNAREGWWRMVSTTGNFRPSTMEAFKIALKDRPGAVIDCGAWIGVTTLAAVNLKATRVYALEVNPVVFLQLAYNIAINPNAAAVATAVFMGASGAVAEREFAPADCSHDIGDKCSSMVAKPRHAERWRVQTLPLDQFVDAEGIPHEELSVIKLSTAGGEVDILPPLVPWLAAWTGRKPTIVLELMGVLMAPVRPDWVATVTPFLRLFKYGYLLIGGTQEMGEWEVQWQGAGASTAAPDSRCVPNSCDYVLSDVPLDGLHITRRP